MEALEGRKLCSTRPGRRPRAAATGTIYRMQKNLRFSFTPQSGPDPELPKE
jgi:hypothetical protein